MFAEKAFELVKELDRSPDMLLAYNDELVRQVLKEMKTLYSQNLADVKNRVLKKFLLRKVTQSGVDGLFPTIRFRHYSIERNRRCLLAYLHNRLMTIKNFRWEIGSVLMPEIKTNLSPNECKWFQNYNENLAKYMRSIGSFGGIDLTLNTKPPKSLYLEVRCLVDYGEFQTEEGTVLILRKGTMHFLQRSEAEQLIREGILEHIIM